MILAEAQLAKNVLLNIAGTTPYQALYGRTPNMLPKIVDGATLDSSVDDRTGLPDRHCHRLREISVGSIVETTAQKRIEIAEKSKTRMSGEALDLKTGDQVEIWRSSGNKDVSGWKGPATVTGLNNLGHGTVHVDWQGRVPQCAGQRFEKGAYLLVFPYVISVGNRRIRFTDPVAQGLRAEVAQGGGLPRMATE